MAVQSKTSDKVLGYGCLLLIFGVIVAAGSAYDQLDSWGFIQHDAETTITAQQNWFVGEAKYCFSTPTTVPSPSQAVGYAFDFVKCDEGGNHQIKVHFWGRKVQPEYLQVYWKCTRHESDFECLETGGDRSR